MGSDAEIASGERDGVTVGEHAEIRDLRRQVRRLEEEKLILQKAAAYFARENRSAAMTFRLIDRERAHHAVSLLCSVLGVTRQGFWAWSKRPVSARRLADEQLKARILELWRASHETYGAPRLHADLCLGDGLKISKKRVARLMRELGIEGVSRRRGRIPHDAAGSACRAGAGSCQARLSGLAAGRDLGRGHHLYPDL